MSKKVEQGQATRDRLIAVARARFAADGYEGTPIEEILREAEVSKGALYHHFGGKAELFEAVFTTAEAEVMERVLAAIGADPEALTDPVRLLRAGVAAWLEITADPAVRAISIVEAPTVLGWAKWRAIDAEYGFGLVKTAVAQAVDEGVMVVPSIDVAAHVILATCGEVALLAAAADDPAQAFADGARVVEGVIDSFVVDR